MRMTIRRKLLGSYLLLILTLGGIVYGYLHHALDQYLVDEIAAGLLSEARLAGLAAAGDITALRRDAPAAATALAHAGRSRVTLIDRQGNVLGDSEVQAGELGGLENHRERPEVVAALTHGVGKAIRYSATLHTQMLYVAVPFAPSGGESGIVRLALPLSTVAKARARMETILGAALLLATAAALVLSSILSHVASRSLKTMTATAELIGNGEFSRRIPVTGNDELGELAKAMNRMAVLVEAELESTRREKNRLDGILRGMGEGLMVADRNGIVTLVNPAFRSLFGLAEEVAGKPLIDISRVPALHEAFRMVVETRKECLGEIVLPPPGETTVLTHWVPLPSGRGLDGVVAVFHDISDLKKLERVRKDFVANVSHELRTPVTVIRGYAETLLAGPDHPAPEQVARFIGKIHTHAERLAALVADLLVLSELESPGMALEIAPVAIELPARRAAALLEQKAREKAIAVDLAGIAAAPPVLADSQRLEQVFVNLLDNALKYTDPGGSVIVSATETGEFVSIAVADSGIGIAPKQLPRLFERFYRVDPARGRADGGTGTGLGLSIVKHIIQLHGGTVDVTSTPGKGSTFSFSLRKAARQSD